MRETQRQIADSLYGIETDEVVCVLYACESGSRAWGFASRDSDYDVRFIYVRPRDWYLAIDLENRRDVIERPLSGDLDLIGWDLRKALKLLYRSNPPLFEWLSSPIIYLERLGFAERLRSAAKSFYAPTACIYHYVHMAQGNYREYLHGNTVWLKKYFYVLRPLLAVRWIEAELGIVPMEFRRLVQAVVVDPGLRFAIDSLLERKMAGEELDYGPKIPVISEFIEGELARLASAEPQPPSQRPDPEALNRVFIETIAAEW